MRLTEICEREERYNKEVDGVDLYEMANIHQNIHGIPDVVIWVGRSNEQHGLRIKVSNKKGKFDPNDNFFIMMPSLDYNEKRVAKWITPKHINMIKQWVKLNQPLLYDYEQGKIDDTYYFLQNISSV